VLKDMGRGYTSADVRKLTRDLRSRCPEFGFTADVLVGYPTEREEDVEETVRLLDECGFHRVHLFPFSPRPGTRAASLKPVPSGVVKERMERLRELGSRLLARSLEGMVGREVEVVVESASASASEKGRLRGLTGTYHGVRFLGAPELTGKIVRVRVESADGQSLAGVMEEA
jgi:tRNA A37 methylthiotransferase MiaB